MSRLKLLAVDDVEDGDEVSAGRIGSWSDPFGASAEQPVQHEASPAAAQVRADSSSLVARAPRPRVRRQRLLDQILESFVRTGMRPLGGIETWAAPTVGTCKFPLAGCAIGALAEDRGPAFVAKLGGRIGCITSGFDTAFADRIEEGSECPNCSRRNCAIFEVGAEAFWAMGDGGRS